MLTRSIKLVLLLLLVADLCCALADTEPSPEPAGPKITAGNVARLRERPAIAKDVYQIVQRPDGKQVAFVPWQKPAEVLDATGLRLVRKVGEGRRVIAFAFSPKRDVAALAENGIGAEILNLRTGKSTPLDVGRDQVSLAFSPDGKLLATGGYNNGARLWDAETGREVRSLDAAELKGGLTVVFSPDGKLLAVGNRNATTRLFEVATGKLLHTLDRQMSHELKFHPSGKTLAVAYVDGSVRLWDVAGGKLLHEAKAHAEELYSLDWSPAGDVLVTAGRMSSVQIWDPRNLSILRQFEAPEWVIRVRFTPDGSQLLAAGGGTLPGPDRKVRVWSVP